jgi:HSP20 family molecular chaperone IbpA
MDTFTTTVAPTTWKFVNAADTYLVSQPFNQPHTIYETIDAFEVEIPLPGIVVDEVKIFYENNELRVVVQPKNNSVDKTKKIIWNGFHRHDGEYKIQLPKCEYVDADMKDGILYVHASKIVKGIEVAIRA